MGITKKYKSPITIQGIAQRIWKREGNIYKLEVIQNILRMYFDECEKALENGERVGLSKIGSLSPRVHTKLTYNIPSMNAEEGNKPYTSLKFTRGCANKEKKERTAPIIEVSADDFNDYAYYALYHINKEDWEKRFGKKEAV